MVNSEKSGGQKTRWQAYYQLVFDLPKSEERLPKLPGWMSKFLACLSANSNRPTGNAGKHPKNSNRATGIECALFQFPVKLLEFANKLTGFEYILPKNGDSLTGVVACGKAYSQSTGGQGVMVYRPAGSEV